MKKCLSLCVFVMMTACGSDAPTTPTPPPVVPECQTQNTATVFFHNNGSRTIDVIWDGGVLGTLNPGATSSGTTAAAGVAHTFDARITNTSNFPCMTLKPIPIQCTSQTYGTCSGF